jgi:hypothetical protein
MSLIQKKSAKQAFAAIVLGLFTLVMAACSTAGTSSVPAVSIPGSASTPTTTASQTPTDLTGDIMPKGYRFTTLNDQADPTFNQLLGINDNGVIAGYFGSGATGHPNKGYTLSRPYGQKNYSNENFPGSVQTQVTAINDHGQTAGFWVDGNGNNFGFILWKGHFTSYKDPNTGTGTVNQLLGLNDNGIAVGFYTDGQGVNHAYMLDRHNGKFTEIVPPHATSATATGINDHGDVTGFLTKSDGSTVGFLLRGKSFTEFSFHGSKNTTPFGINQYDQIVGVYVDANNNMHGFLVDHVWKHANFLSIDDPNGVGTTTVNGLNDKGQLVGFYVDGAGNTDGFLANPR